MVSGKSSKAVRNARAAVVTKRSTPWGLIAAVGVIVLFAAAVFGYVYQRSQEPSFVPTAANQDPSEQIEGVVTQEFQGGVHVQANQQVAYTQSPPFGGAHDNIWATCNGVVYPEPVRSENMVHSLEHGAVWIAYDPARISGDALAQLSDRVEGESFMVMSPYPGLDAPIALQSWGHQLKLDDPADPRIDQFIQALRQNQYTFPEFGATCDEIRSELFTAAAPPPYQPAPDPSQVDGQTVVDPISPAS